MLGMILLIGGLVMGGSGGDGGPGVGFGGHGVVGDLGGGWDVAGQSLGNTGQLGMSVGDPVDLGNVGMSVGPPASFDDIGMSIGAPADITDITVGGSSMNPFTRAALQFMAQKGLAPVFGQMGKAGMFLGATPMVGGLANAGVNAMINPPQTAEQGFAMLGSAIANAMTLGLLGIPAGTEGDVSTMGFSGPDMVEPSVGGSPFDAIAAGLSQGAFAGAPPVEAPVEAPAAPAPMPEYSLSPQPFGWYGMKRVNMPWVSQRPGFSGNYGGMKRVDE